MPFNLLLLPLLGGLLLITRAHLFTYTTSASLAYKEILLFYASMAGIVLLILSRLTCWTIAHFAWGMSLAAWLHSVAPFDFFGTALGAIIIALVAVRLFNIVVPEQVAGMWLYHRQKFNKLESLMLNSAIGVAPACKHGQIRLFFGRLLSKWFPKLVVDLPRGDPLPIMCTTEDDKVYVGFIADIPPLRATGLEFIRLLPIWTGYRDSVTKQVRLTTPYAPAVQQHPNQIDLFLKVLPIARIRSANIFIDNAFPIPSDSAVAGQQPNQPRTSTAPQTP